MHRAVQDGGAAVGFPGARLRGPVRPARRCVLVSCWVEQSLLQIMHWPGPLKTSYFLRARKLARVLGGDCK